MQLQRKEHGQMFTSTIEIINSTEYCRKEQKDLIQMPVFQKMEKNLQLLVHLQTIKSVSGTGNKKIFYLKQRPSHKRCIRLTSQNIIKIF